jgi:hypothetical protein
MPKRRSVCHGETPERIGLAVNFAVLAVGKTDA